MTVKIIAATVFGGIIGFIYPEYSSLVDPVISVFLLITMFFVGIEFGRDKEFFKHLRESASFLVYPILIALGSLFGAAAAGLILPTGVLETVTVGSAFGWYSLSAPLIGNLVSEELGATAFLANLSRELFTFILAPLLASSKLKGDDIKALTFAPAGATSMDVTLPVILKAAGPKTAIAAFISGAVLSMLAPVLLQFFISLLI